MCEDSFWPASAVLQQGSRLISLDVPRFGGSPCGWYGFSVSSSSQLPLVQLFSPSLWILPHVATCVFGHEWA